MGPRCSSAETQVCHRSYIIAAKYIRSGTEYKQTESTGLPSNQNNQSRLNSNQLSLLTSDSQPGPSRPNQNLGMSCDPIIFTEPHNSGGSNTFNAIDTRLQEFQFPENISSVF